VRDMKKLDEYTYHDLLEWLPDADPATLQKIMIIFRMAEQEVMRREAKKA